MHDSYTPIGGAAPLVNIMLGEVDPGGTGSGLYGMLLFALLSVFIAGLMVGRTPEYLGKKIQGPEMKLVVLYILIVPLVILGFTAISMVMQSSLQLAAQHRPARPHRDDLRVHVDGEQQRLGVRRSQRQHATGSTSTGGLAMLIGRFMLMIPVLAIAGSLGPQAGVAAVGRHVPDEHAAVRGAAHRRGRDRRRPHVLPRRRARPGRRAPRRKVLRSPP